MPFTAICPHCRNCRLRAPRAKHGKPIRCPKCREVFPLIPQEDDGDQTFVGADSALDASALPTTSQQSSTGNENPREELLPLAQIAVGLVVVVLFLSQLPYGRSPALLISIIGACGAGFALTELKKQSALLALIGLLLNGLLSVILIAYPATLGLTGWWSEANRTVSENVENPFGDWIDAGDAGWQQGGVRVSVTFATIGGEPSSSSASGTKGSYLWVGFKITNVGVGGDIEFSGWRGKGTEGLEMTTTDGTPLTYKQFAGSKEKSVIQPGKSLECMIAFEIPTPGLDLLLSLPTQPLGDIAVIRFRIPHVLIGR
jgi:hypothetical protein